MRKAKAGPSRPQLSFLGGARSVTGSRFLVETDHSRVLVDCGLFQGLKDLRLRNWQPFPVAPSSIDAVLLTHAHIDHSGYLPALIRDGFVGRIYATEETRKLCSILLPDCGYLQERDASYANKVGFSKHQPAMALYTEQDGEKAIGSFEPVPFAQEVEITPDLVARWMPAGHILGSAMISLEIRDERRSRKILFTGDLGRPSHPLLTTPSPLTETDILVTESTYGDRVHEDEMSALHVIEQTINATVSKGGNIIIPAFAVDRTEVVLLLIKKLVEKKMIPSLPVFVDSPMALKTLEVYREAIREGRPDIKADLNGMTSPFDPGNLIEAKTVDESKAIRNSSFPSIIISASGMATGGRILHHLAHYLPDHRNSVIMVGFQAAGTRGRSLVEGVTSLKLLGRYVKVRASVVEVDAFSVHADSKEILDWLSKAKKAPEMTYVVHGEEAAAVELSRKIEEQLSWPAVVPHLMERVRLD